MMRSTRAMLALTLIAATAVGAAKSRQEINEETEARLKKDVTFLAGPECEGRGPATEGLKKAGKFLATEFQKLGLKPAFSDGYFQPFAIAGAKGSVVLTGPKGKRVELKPGVDFSPLGGDQPHGKEKEAKVSGGLVFAGFGHQDTKAAYDDFAGIDVKGKVVVLLTGSPGADASKVPSFLQQMRLGNKLALAQKHGAEAVIVVNDSATAGDADKIVDYSYGSVTRGGRHLPAFLARRAVIDAVLSAAVDRTLASIEKAIHKDKKADSFAIPDWKADVEVKRLADALPLRNVVGVLEGAGPLAGETVVIGAHYDHLGHGGPSSLDAATKYAIHYGADDNASGTAAMLELARRFAAIKDRQGRRMVFVGFAGEEQGLFGSKAYCDKPPFPLDKTASMFNLDMVGQLRDDAKTGKGKMLTEGHGTAKPFKEMIDTLATKHNFVLTSQASGFGPSDHASFTAKKVPVLFFWTGTHADYHKSSDTADKINFAGIRRIVDMSEEVVGTLAKMERPEFVEVKGTGGVRPSSGPRLGVRPGYGGEQPGVEVESVIAGGPAEKGGIKDGDVIVAISGKEVKNLQTYMSVMSTQKPKTTIKIDILRMGKKMTVEVPLE